MIGKQIIYQNRGRRNAYLMVHFERLMDLERESEEMHALKSNSLENMRRNGNNIQQDNNGVANIFAIIFIKTFTSHHIYIHVTR